MRLACSILLAVAAMAPGPLAAADAEFLRASCLPPSVLAATGDLPARRSDLTDVIAWGARALGSADDANGQSRSALERAAERGGSVGAEARCWLARSARGEEASRAWKRLGPLRVRGGGSAGAVLAATLDRAVGIAALVQLPEVAGWAAVADAAAPQLIMRQRPDRPPAPEVLRRAAARWPEVTARWLRGAVASAQADDAMLSLAESLGVADAASEPQDRPPGLDAVLVLAPLSGEGARVGEPLRAFLRQEAATLNDGPLLQVVDEASDSTPALRMLTTSGAAVAAVVGPFRQPPPPLALPPGAVWLLDGEDPLPDGALQLGTTTRHEFAAHHRALDGGLAGPALVVAPASADGAAALARLRSVAPDLHATLLTYDDGLHDLSGTAELIRQGAPATLVLDVPHDHAGRLLRYLARAGVWARREGKEVRKGELHPWLLAPGSWALDPDLQRTNRDYLDGVRVATDLPPIDRWPEQPQLAAWVERHNAWPPVAAVRVAALLHRVAAAARGAAATGTTVRDWLPGPTPLGPLMVEDDALTFGVRVFMFTRGRFDSAPTSPR